MKILLLDVMDTLVRDPFWKMPGFFDMSFEELIAVIHPTAWPEFEKGRIDEETFLGTLFADGRDYDRAGLCALIEEHYAYLEGIESLLGELQDAGVAMHALSNYPSWWKRIEAKLELSRYLEWSFVSCMTGYRKPHPGAYLGAARTLGVPPSGCLFVDDRERNVAAARAAGMPGLRFESASQLRGALVTEGLLV